MGKPASLPVSRITETANYAKGPEPSMVMEVRNKTVRLTLLAAFQSYCRFGGNKNKDLCRCGNGGVDHPAAADIVYIET